MEEKLCQKCGTIKSINDFYINVHMNDERYAECKVCVKERTKKWHRLHPECGCAATKKYRGSNPDKCRIATKKWCKNHPENMTEIYRRRNNKIRSKPIGKLNCNMKSGVNYSLRGRKKDNIRWNALVGYTVEQLKAHLEKLFNDEMSWDNYGKFWEIDHIIPIAAHNYSSHDDIDFKKCWNLKNLRPLKSGDNSRKKDSLISPFQPSLAIQDWR